MFTGRVIWPDSYVIKFWVLVFSARASGVAVVDAVFAGYPLKHAKSLPLEFLPVNLPVVKPIRINIVFVVISSAYCGVVLF